MPDDDKESRPRVAVIAVHGVADQAAGDTARALADLLIRTPPDGVRYGPAKELNFTLKVDPVVPTGELGARGAPAPSSQAARRDIPVRPDTFGQRLKKAWRQSYASDFHRQQWAVDATAKGDPIRVGRATPTPLSPGPELSDFMLFKARRNAMASEAYRTTRLRLPRVGAAANQVDVYEMYWADLSRLAGSVPRIVTELFTFLFRLSLLGRDTVRSALRSQDSPGRAWRVLNTTQTALDWVFSRVLAMLMLQLVMVALVLVPMGLLRGRESTVAAAVSAAAVIVAYLIACYRRAGPHRSVLAALLAVGLAVLAGSAARGFASPATIVGVVWLAGLTAVYAGFMRMVEARFPFTAPVGWGLWGAVALAVVFGAAAGAGRGSGAEVWIGGALLALEAILAAGVVTWVAIAVLMLVWLPAGALAARSGVAQARASVSTGRFGALLSASFFLVLVMAIWAMVSDVVGLAVAGVSYAPIVFKDGGVGGIVDAQAFLKTRYVDSTEAFSLVASIDLLLLVYLLVFFLPSALAELKVERLEPTRLGRWLAIGFRYLDTRPIRWLTYLSALISAAVLAYLAWWQWHRLGFAVADPALADTWFGGVIAQYKALSASILSRLVIGAAGVTVAFSAFGGLLSRYVPWLRAPLDVALDVDNHFREFPRAAIPRARIFARYLALLRHIDAQGYDEVIIVAHSQGTVITAELLLYMHERAQNKDRVDADAEVVSRIRAKARLLTMGCPLRQLYAARFPTLYGWVLTPFGAGVGPRAADLGVQRWVNAYTTGDYVGRWLWTRPPEAQRDLSATMVEEGPDGRSVHLGTPRTELEARLAASVETDICLGSGAHTHYFEPVGARAGTTAADATAVVHLIDRLIAGDSAVSHTQTRM